MAAAVPFPLACSSGHERTRPVEVPISEYRFEPPDAGIGNREEMVPIGSDVAAGSEPKPAPEISAVATKLDEKKGMAGVQMGTSLKAFRGLKLTDKSGDRSTYRVQAKVPSYAGAAFKDVVFTFNKGKLATMIFSVKSSSDCKTVKDTLERDFGAPQKSTPTPNETHIWRGDKVGLRFSLNSSGSCGGTLLSHDLGDPATWAGLEP